MWLGDELGWWISIFFDIHRPNHRDEGWATNLQLFPPNLSPTTKVGDGAHRRGGNQALINVEQLLLNSQMFFEIDVLKNFAIFTWKHLCWRLLGLQLIKRSFQHRCFPVKFAKFLRALFFTEHLQWLLLLCVLKIWGKF